MTSIVAATGLVYRPLAGVVCMLFAAALFVAMDSVAKYLGQYYATSQLVWARYSVHLLVLFFYLIVSKNLDRRTLISNAPFGQLLRGFLLLGSTAFSYLAVREFPLTQVYVINFSSPIIVTVFAIIILKERVGLGRVLAILSGFLGVIVAIKPDRMFVEPALIYPILMAFFFAFYQITTRHFGNQDSALTSLLYTAVAGGVVGTFLIDHGLAFCASFTSVTFFVFSNYMGNSFRLFIF